MGVAVKKEFRSGRGMRRRDMDEMEPVPEPLQFEAHRPIGLVVLISPDDENLWTQIPDRLERRLFTDIAEMPDLVGIADGFEQGRDETVVGIRDDGDAERPGHLADGVGEENRPDFSRIAAGRPLNPGHKHRGKEKVRNHRGAQKGPSGRESGQPDG